MENRNAFNEKRGREKENHVMCVCAIDGGRVEIAQHVREHLLAERVGVLVGALHCSFQALVFGRQVAPSHSLLSHDPILMSDVIGLH